MTAGSQSTRLESLFPPNIPIGVVTQADDAELSQFQRVHIRPFADRFAPDTFQLDADGDREALRQLAESATAHYGKNESDAGVWGLSAEDAHELVVTVVALQEIIPGVAGHRVIARPPDELVRAVAAGELVVAVITL